MEGQIVSEGHLGGYMTGEHGDPATYYPDLWRWLVEGPLKIRSVVDIGCGEGHSLRFFRELGVQVYGVDGMEQEDKDIYAHDFAKGEWYGPPVDLAWCCEFVEHVEEKYARNFISAMQMAGIVLMTHAFPGQLGYHHVNCREPEYWKGFMAASRFRFSQGLTTKTRELAAKNTDQYNHYLRSGLAFRKD